MLLPVAAVAVAGLVTFRLSVSTLEEFRQETVEESKRIDVVRNLLVEAGASRRVGGTAPDSQPYRGRGWPPGWLG
jgi:hypothetical protein